MKQLFYSCLLDMRGLWPAQHYAPCWLQFVFTFSYPRCARGVIVNNEFGSSNEFFKVINVVDEAESRHIFWPFVGDVHLLHTNG